MPTGIPEKKCCRCGVAGEVGTDLRTLVMRSASKQTWWLFCQPCLEGARAAWLTYVNELKEKR